MGKNVRYDKEAINTKTLIWPKQQRAQSGGLFFYGNEQIGLDQSTKPVSKIKKYVFKSLFDINSCY